MNNLHMTDEEWLEYLRNHENPAVLFIRDLTSACNKSFIDWIDTDLTRQAIMIEIHKLQAVLDRQKIAETQRSINNWKS